MFWKKTILVSYYILIEGDDGFNVGRTVLDWPGKVRRGDVDQIEEQLKERLNKLEDVEIDNIILLNISYL